MPDVRWLTRYGPEGASSRYRAFQLDGGLAAHGWTSSFEPMTEWRGSGRDQLIGIGRRLRSLRQPGRGVDVCVVQKEPVMPPSCYRLVARSIRSAGSPIVWDIDDAVWLGRRGATSMAADMCRTVDHVVAGNRLLGDWARHNGAKDVTVIPTCFDPVTDPENRSSAGGPRVVWIGSPATAPLVEPYAESLRSALDSLPTMSIEFVGGSAPPELRSHDRVVSTGWSPESEQRALARADFGLALQDRNEYTDHKCGFKIVQYLAYGIVPIASDGPVHADIVDGHGLLLSGSEDADSMLERLEASPSEHERRSIVEHHRANFSVRRAVDDWATVLDGLGRVEHPRR